MRTFLATLLLMASLALASAPKQVSMPVGRTTTLSMSAPVSSIVVDDPALLEVSRKGRHVVLVGRTAGVTDVTVKTVDGAVVALHIYVASDKYSLP